MKTIVLISFTCLLYMAPHAMPLNANDRFCQYLQDHWMPTVESAIVDQISRSRLYDESQLKHLKVSVRKELLNPIVKDFSDRIHFLDSHSTSFLPKLLDSWKESTEMFLWNWINRYMGTGGSKSKPSHKL